MIKLHLKQLSNGELELDNDFQFIRSASVRPVGANNKKTNSKGFKEKL